MFSKSSSRLGHGGDLPGKGVSEKRDGGETLVDIQKPNEGTVVPKRSWEGKAGDVWLKQKVMSWETVKEMTSDLRKHSSNGNGVGRKNSNYQLHVIF